MSSLPRGLRTVALALIAGVSLAACGTPAGTPVLQGGHEPWFLATAGRALSQAACRDARIEGIRLESDRAEIRLAHAAGNSDVRMRHASARCRECLVAGPFAVEFDPADDCARSVGAALHRDLEAGDPPEETRGLTGAERDQVLSELKAIMAVYDSCRPDPGPDPFPGHG